MFINPLVQFLGIKSMKQTWFHVFVMTIPQNKDHTEGQLTSEALKFVSSRISHYACCPPLLWPVNDKFWPLNTLYWLAARLLASKPYIFAYKNEDTLHP